MQLVKDKEVQTSKQGTLWYERQFILPYFSATGSSSLHRRHIPGAMLTSVL